MRGSNIFGTGVVGVVLTMSAGQVWAQACCSASTAGEAGIVGRCHKGMVSTSLGMEQGMGIVDADGEFERYETANSVDVVWSVAGGFRPFDRRFRVGAVLPIRTQHRDAGDLASTETGLGDIGASTGFLFTEDPMNGISESWMPFTEVYLGGTWPTGRAPDESTDALGASITSTGSASLSGGLRVIKFVVPEHALRVTAEYQKSFEHTIDNWGTEVGILPGDSVNLGFGWTYEKSVFWSVGAYGRASFQGAMRVDDQEIQNSEVRRLFTGLTFRRSLQFPWWDATLSGGQDMVFGDNLARAGFAWTLGVQRNFL
jgi:hypothetical protein